MNYNHMSLKVGIVGLPNVGKSTLFKAITKKQVDCANFPFCTIEPNVGIVAVPDERLNQLAAISKSEKVVPAVVEFVDIAGLVAGASKGEGLGNKFLSHIRECDAIVEVVRAFVNDDIIHVGNRISPADDIEIINLELVFADMATVEKRLETAQKQSKAGKTRESEIITAALTRILAALSEGKMASSVELSDDERLEVKQLQLLTMKPLLYVANVDEEQLKAGYQIPGIDPTLQIPICAKLEEELATLPEEELADYLSALGLTMTGLNTLIRAAYRLLGLMTFLTTGVKETRAWTTPLGSKAPQAAGVIHTDFEKAFIRAEIYNWKDLVDLKSESAIKEAGKIRVEGKEYTMQEGDVCNFRVGV